MTEKRRKLLKVAGIPIGEIEIIKTTQGGYHYGDVKLWTPMQGNLKMQFESGGEEQLTGDASSENH